jgi:hypothetical protein
MDKRLIFPVIMFALAGASFAYGTWQYIFAHQTQVASTRRMAYITTTIEKSNTSRAQKESLYASIMHNLPSGPTFLGIDLSGSFASQGPADTCTSDGQRAICQALKDTGTDPKTFSAICGLCHP